MTTFKASTPHGIHLYAPTTPDRIDPAEHEPIRVLPAAADPPRMGVEVVGWTEIDGIPVAMLRPTAATGLPEPVDGVWHIVSTPTALSALGQRGDLLVNHLSVRDLDGRVVGARALGMFVGAAGSNPVGGARPKLIITRGLPGSGKTTWAKLQSGTVRVNRDDLRNMFTPDWDHGNRADEDLVTEVQFEAIGLWLARGRTVIVDDTNLRPDVVERLRQFAEACFAEFKVVDFTHIPVEQCIAHDLKRFGTSAYVGAPMIRAMHDRYLATKTEVAP